MNYSQICELKLQILSNNEPIELKDKILKVVDSLPQMSTNEKLRCIDILYNEIKGYGAIQKFLDDKSISEIMINGIEHIFVEKNGEIFPEKPVFESTEHLMQLIYKIASEIGREVNQSRPILDARLKDGSRVNVVLSPVAISGPIVTIRKFNNSATTMATLAESGTFTNELRKFLEILIKSKYNIFISGGTGTGKTTLLNYLCQSIPNDERIITIEDAAEIDIKNHEHVISMETRNSNVSDTAVTMSKLIKNALRMRPDRIIVGEVRGEEVIDMLQAMNTGHEGSISTGHSNSPLDMLIRLEVISASYSEIDHNLIRKQIISAIDIVIQLERNRGRRQIEYVVEIKKDSEEYEIHTIYDRRIDQNTTQAGFEERICSRYKLDKYFEGQAKSS
ncbi:CpaF family protein, partial [Bacteroides heparinolyticus]|uniref:CpaF family protein n=1 Tax=Prevotella heparinolytica TaxID=28113 RepID=UPI00359F9EFC